MYFEIEKFGLMISNYPSKLFKSVEKYKWERGIVFIRRKWNVKHSKIEDVK
jgi:hypothetical protein